MTYEFCLEYGSYPLKEASTDDLLTVPYKIPDFIQDNKGLCHKLQTMNTLFHELFISLESQAHYIGHEFPDKISQIRSLYEETSQELLQTYPDKTIIVEYFVL